MLLGGEGDDALFGDSGEDSLRGGLGADALNGGADFDTATYSLAASGVAVNLLNPAGNSGEAAGDTYASIEQVIGTQHADILIGDNGDNAFAGLGGDDSFIGRGGADAFNGGTGTDAVSYSTASAGVKVDFIVAGNNAGDALGDTFVLVENITGSQLGDTLAGDSNANTISGLNGNDTLRGRGGADVLIGGGAADTFLIQPGTQSDTVNDLVSGVDTIRLLSFAGIGNIGQLKAVGADNGANSSYNLGGGDTLFIIGHHVADLQAGDFLFS
jgi:serralysin